MTKRVYNIISVACRRMFPNSYGLIKAIRLLIFRKDSFLYTSGLFHTYKAGRPESQKGEPLPWMNYNVISFLKERLTKDLSLFEYGSGYSTFFYSTLVGKVVSVEHDSNWYQAIQSNVPSNVQLFLITENTTGKYCRMIREMRESFDVVIIDGIDRINCMYNAVDVLSDKGVILLDDSQRNGYIEGIDFLKKKGFKKLDFEGIAPSGHICKRTSVFYRVGNCLCI